MYGLQRHPAVHAPAEVLLQHLCLVEFVYNDDICLMVGKSAQLQAILGLLASYHAAFTCNGQPVKQVTSFAYAHLLVLLYGMHKAAF